MNYLRGNPSAKKAIEGIKRSQRYIAEITLFELGDGIFRNRGKKDFDQLIRFVETIQIIPTTTMFALDAAAIGGQLRKKGITIPTNDLLIAGMMLNFGMSRIVTRDKKHFGQIKGIEVIEY